MRPGAAQGESNWAPGAKSGLSFEGPTGTLKLPEDPVPPNRWNRPGISRENLANPPSNLEQQSAHTLVTTAASVLIGFLLNIVLSRSLGPAGKGVLDLTSATAGLLVLVLGLSLNASLTQRIASRGGAPSGLTAQLALWGAAAGLLSAALLFGLPGFCTQIGLLPARDLPFWSLFISGSVAAGVFATGLRGVLVGQHDLITANRIDLGLKAALLAAYLVLAFALPPNARYFALAGLGAAVALPGAILPALRAGTGYEPGLWRGLVGVTLPIHGTNIIHFINQRADIFFVQAFHGTVEVALYALAVSLAQCLLFLSSALAQPLLPRIAAAASPDEAAAHTAGACRLFILLGVGAILPLALGGVWLVPLVFGRDFSGSLT